VEGRLRKVPEGDEKEAMKQHYITELEFIEAVLLINGSVLAYVYFFQVPC
jgi:hypothetical protein